MRIFYTVDIELECEGEIKGQEELVRIFNQHPQLDYKIVDSNITEDDEIED